MYKVACSVTYSPTKKVSLKNTPYAIASVIFFFFYSIAKAPTQKRFAFLLCAKASNHLSASHIFLRSAPQTSSFLVIDRIPHTTAPPHPPRIFLLLRRRLKSPLKE